MSDPSPYLPPAANVAEPVEQSGKAASPSTPVLAKLFAVLLAIAGVLLILAGALALGNEEPRLPMVFAMLIAIVVFGLGCFVASIGIFHMRRFGFVLCLIMGLAAGVFALVVLEAPGEGVLWPIFALMTASGGAGLVVKSRSDASGETAP